MNPISTGPSALAGTLRDGGSSTLRLLAERARQAIQDEATLPITPPEDPGEAMDRFVRNIYANDFMQSMLFDDEEKTGMKAEPWD